MTGRSNSPSALNTTFRHTASLGKRTKSDIKGYDSLPITFSKDGVQKKTTNFLISNDNNTLARLGRPDEESVNRAS